MRSKKAGSNQTLGSLLIQGLGEAAAYEEGKITLKSHDVVAIEQAPKFTKTKVKALREKKLNVSQAVFAEILNVSDKTVKAWEQGINRPSKSSARLLQLLEKDPRSITQLLSV